jgi:hypothetical protein
MARDHSSTTWQRHLFRQSAPYIYLGTHENPRDPKRSSDGSVVGFNANGRLSYSHFVEHLVLNQPET